MRPFLLAAAIALSGLVAGVAATGGEARSTTPGDGCLVVQGGYGKITLTLTRGVVFGRYSEGVLLYNDQGGDVHPPSVPGVSATKPTDHVWKYSNASDVRFRASGPTRLIINAQFVNLSVAGKGTASLSAADWNGVPSTLSPPSNAFSVDAASFCEDNFQKMPQTLAKYPIASPIAG